MTNIKYIGKCLIVDVEGSDNLIVGDIHLGFEEALEKSGTLIGRRMFKEMIVEFDKIFDSEKERKKKIRRVIFLGDVKHEFFELSRQEREDLTKLISYLEEKMGGEGEVIFIKGNHDNYLISLKAIDKVEVKDYFIIGECCFLHGDKDFAEAWSKEIKVWMMGHLHPAVRIRDRKGVREEKYKCFLEGDFKGKKVFILPSFSPYSEGSDPREEGVNVPWNFDLSKFQVKIVGEDLEVLEFGRLGNL